MVRTEGELSIQEVVAECEDVSPDGQAFFLNNAVSGLSL